MPRLKETMTIGMLIEQLKNFSPDTEVYFAYNYGDHWNTEVVEPVKDAEEHHIRYSEYHRMETLAKEGCEDTDKLVVVLQ